MGQRARNPQVGLLFIDFVAERPTRLRVEGTASSATTTSVFPNCPRYIHRMALVERSPYVPSAGNVTPIPEWKHSELATGVLPKGDRAGPGGAPGT